MSNQGSFLDYLGGNSFEVDAQSEEQKIREKYPYLLHKDERIELAYKTCGGWGRDKQFLTNKRLLLKDGKGIGSKRRNYLSIPYDQIQAFAVETAGQFDGDVELKLWCKGGLYKQTIDFARGIVDIFVVQHYFNAKVFGAMEDGVKRQLSMQEYNQTLTNLKEIGSMESFFNFLGNDGVLLDAKEVEQRLKTLTPVLTPNEKVLLAYKCGRDTTVLTDTRFMDIDVQGLMGKKVEFFSMKWECVKAYAVETAGKFERDTDFTLHTNIWKKRYIRQDLHKSRANIFEVQKVFNDIILGEDAAPLPDVDLKEGHEDPGTKFWQYGGSNARPLDAVLMDRLFHEYPAILQSDEKVEMAFKGRRDMSLFTTKRLIDIDIKGIYGKKIEYTSLPWSSVVAFGVQTAGKHFDLDCEALIWTDIMYKPGGGEDDPPEPAMSFLELDFNKDMVDILSIKRYLSARCLNEVAPGVKIPTDLISSAPAEAGFEKFLSKIGHDHIAIDANMVNTEFHTNLRFMMDDEHVVMAFKAGRDLAVFTNMRIIQCDTKGLSGQKVEYVSIPYGSVRAFSAESAGSWDRDSEIDLYTPNHWTLSKVSLDFRKGKTNIIAVQKFLSSIILENHDDLVRFTANSEGSDAMDTGRNMMGFMDFILDNTVELDAGMVDSQLHSNPNILMSDERALKVWRENRDLWVYTNKRVLLVDVKGFTGKKVKYKSIPYSWMTGFAVETAGHLDRDAEVFMYNNIPSQARNMQKILVAKGDVFDMHVYLTNKLLFDE